MKRALVMLVTVVLSLPLVSFGGSESSIGHTKSAVSNSRSNSNNSGTLTVAPSITSVTDDQTGSNSQSTSTATASVTTVKMTTQSAGLNPPGFGTAVIDGVMSPSTLIADVMSPGEWDNAVKIDFNANGPGGGTTPATLYIMNDSFNLYLAVKITGSSFGSLPQFIADFDNNNDGIMEDGEDGFMVGTTAYGSVMSVDTYLFNCPSSATDPANCKKASDTDPNQGIQPYGDGQRITLHIGNPSSARFSNVTMKVTWGPRMPIPSEDKFTERMSAWGKATREKDINLTEAIEPSRWTRVVVTLAPAKSDEFGLLVVSDLKTPMVQMVVAK